MLPESYGKFTGICRGWGPGAGLVITLALLVSGPAKAGHDLRSAIRVPVRRGKYFSVACHFGAAYLIVFSAAASAGSSV